MAGSVNTRETIVRRYLSGESSTEIAASLGISQPHVSRIVRKAGITRSASEGKRLSHSRPEVKAKISAAHTGRKCPEHVKSALRSRVGPSNHNWRGGVTVNAQGYLTFTASESNGAHAGVPFHRLIAEWKIGRAIAPGEHVHHVDGNKLNNDPGNLAVLSHADHARLHAVQAGLGKHTRGNKNA